LLKELILIHEKIRKIWLHKNLGDIYLEIFRYGHFKAFEKNGIQVGHIYGLYLTPKVLRKNLGRSIIELMLVEAKEKKVKEITLESTLTAHDFYQKVGFKDTGDQITVEISGQKVRCYRMKMGLVY